jgi:hypothetical protein
MDYSVPGLSISPMAECHTPPIVNCSTSRFAAVHKATPILTSLCFGHMIWPFSTSGMSSVLSTNRSKKHKTATCKKLKNNISTLSEFYAEQSIRSQEKIPKFFHGYAVQAETLT